MNSDFIVNYMDYKVNCLSECAYLFFTGYNKRFILNKLKRYFEVYVNTCFYHQLGTLDSSIKYDFNDLRNELLGKKLELLDEYSNYELEVSNDLYNKNCSAISSMVDLICFISKIDWDIFINKLDVLDAINGAFDSNSYFDSMLNDKNKFIDLFVNMKDVLDKSLCDNNKNFILEFLPIFDSSEKLLVNLNYNSDCLKTSYKKSLVNFVYDDDEFVDYKMNLLLWKLSIVVLRNFFDNKDIKYFVCVDNRLFKKNRLSFIDLYFDSLFNKSVILSIPYSMYISSKEYFKNQNLNFSCYVDLTCYDDAKDTLNSIDGENFFKYIIITDYNDKDKEMINKYSCQEGVSLFVMKED